MTEKIELQQLDLQEKLGRSVKNLVSREIAGIAYAKTLGKTPEEFGRFFGNMTASFWAEIKGLGPVPFVQYLHRFLQTDKDLKLEIVSSSPAEVCSRMTAYGETTIRALKSSGITLTEYCSYFGSYVSAMAEYLGLRYQQKIEGDWIHFSVAEANR